MTLPTATCNTSWKLIESVLHCYTDGHAQFPCQFSTTSVRGRWFEIGTEKISVFIHMNNWQSFLYTSFIFITMAVM